MNRHVGETRGNGWLHPGQHHVRANQAHRLGRPEEGLRGSRLEPGNPGQIEQGCLRPRFMNPVDQCGPHFPHPHIVELADEWGVEGAIVIQQKFCDPHELDIPAIRKALEDAGVKTLFLELDVTVPVGQFKIRVEAFLEMLAEEDLF